MTKGQVSLMSAVAALPGALLTYGMIVSFMKYSENSPTSFKVLAGFTLVMGILLALLPFAILVFGGPKVAKGEAKAADSGAVAATGAHADVDEEFEPTQPLDDLEVTGDADDADFELGDVTEFAPEVAADEDVDAEVMETFHGESLDDAEADQPDLEHLETFDNVPLEDLEAEAFEEEPPAKGKKKKK